MYMWANAPAAVNVNAPSAYDSLSILAATWHIVS